jgi:hypothetical protein
MQPSIDIRPKVSFVIPAIPKLKPSVHPSFHESETAPFQPKFSPIDLHRLFPEIDTGPATNSSLKRGIRTYDSWSYNCLFARLFSKQLQVDIGSVTIVVDRESAKDFLLRNKYITPGASLNADDISKYVRNIAFMDDQSKKAFNRYCAHNL